MPRARPRNTVRAGMGPSHVARRTSSASRTVHGTIRPLPARLAWRVSPVRIKCRGTGRRERKYWAWIPASYTWMTAPDTCAQLPLPRTLPQDQLTWGARGEDMGALKRANQGPRQLRPINLREEGIRSPPPILDSNAFRRPQSRPVPCLLSSYSHSTLRTIGH